MREYLKNSTDDQADDGAGQDMPPPPSKDVVASPAARPDRLPLVAAMVARLVAARPMTASDVPHLVGIVEATISDLLDPPAQQRVPIAVETKPAEKSPWGKARREKSLTPRRSGERRAPSEKSAAPAPVEAPPPPAPRLVRRAEAHLAVPPAETSPTFFQASSSLVRGIVRWFDPARQTGALRLPGVPEDLMVEPGVFAQSGATRLFKGQEIDAQIDRSGGHVRISAITLPGAATGSSDAGMIAGGRRPRIVIVEKKRDGLKRVAARSEAEQVLGAGATPERSR